MATLLHIFAHPQPHGSLTMRIADTFIDSYRETHDADTVETLDLYAAGVSHLTRDHLEAITLQDTPEQMSPTVKRAWDGTMTLVRQFKRADAYLVTTPMWNFSVPSILKAYIDHIILAGHTFRYTGPGAHIGMMSGRPMVIISSHGGYYSQPPLNELEMCVRYLRNIFDFIGIEITADIISEGLAIAGPHEQDALLKPVLARARDVARQFGHPYFGEQAA